MTNPTAIEPASSLALLRAPFPPNQISKLPKETRAQIDARKSDKNLMVWKCPICGGPHHKNAVHLDYVGHAALTDRLLDADPEWSWEPVAMGNNGLPAIDSNGGLWIKLTVCGVTRLGYGNAEGKAGGDAVKEIIGDALRNAAMRFGAALDLWHKGDLHADSEDEQPRPAPEPQEEPRKGPVKLDGPYTSPTALKTAYQALDRSIRGAPDLASMEELLADPETVALIDQMKRDAKGYVFGSDKLPAEHVPLMALISQTRTQLQAQEEPNEAWRANPLLGG